MYMIDYIYMSIYRTIDVIQYIFIELKPST